MNRRDLMKLGAGAALSSVATRAVAAGKTSQGGTTPPIEQWGTYEIALSGPASGNPYLDTKLAARFRLEHRSVEIPGFYDGEGAYRIRFMPDTIGNWSWETESNTTELSGRTGAFSCVAPQPANHGPVGVAHQFHFQYADGRPFFPFGTTCYSWAFLGEAAESATLDALRTAPFNKVRMCLLPKRAASMDLFAYPFPRDAAGVNDFTRFNPAYFQHIERRVRDLLQLDIEADLILFHPYDAWGYEAMPLDAADRYLRYAIARFSAYRNVWWSLANEYDLIKTRTPADWDRFFHVVQESDPHSHLRSIHHSRVLYDHSKAWVTHASLQTFAFEKTAEWRAACQKPILFDEMQYEGNISSRWGNLSPQEMMRRFWMAIISGAYATHGETYIPTGGAPVWSDGGTLHGSSAPRIAFLRKLLEDSTAVGLNAIDDTYYLSASVPNELYLYFFDYHQPAEYEFPLPDAIKFKADLIDPWEMTIAPIPGTFSGKSKLQLPGKPYLAFRFQKTS